MSARDAILAKIRRSYGVPGSDLIRRRAVTDRLQRTPTGVIPARAQGEGAEKIRLFREKAEAVQATTVCLPSRESTPRALADYIGSHNLLLALRIGDDARLASLDWKGTALTLRCGPSDGGDLICLSHADAGIAETGTLLLTSGPHNPTTLNFLPDFHIVLVEAKTVVGSYEEAFAMLRARFGPGRMPRTVNMITGPSRSADIEQTLLLGAHGPRHLHVVILG